MTSILVPGTLLTLISVVYLFGIAPDMTWMGLAGDAPDYVASSMLFQKAGLGGYPLYISIGWVFQQIFHYGFGLNPYWSLGLFSAISTVIACGYIYAFIRLFSPKSSLPCIVGVLGYAGSLLVWSQSVVPEVYAFTSMLMVVGSYYVIKGTLTESSKYFYISALVFGLSLGTHPITLLALIPCLVYVYKSGIAPPIWKLSLIGSFGLVSWVLQILFAESPYSASRIAPGDSLAIISYMTFVGRQSVFLSPLMERISEAFSMVLVSIAILIPFLVLGIVPAFQRYRKEMLLLGILAVLPFTFYFSSLEPHWITYSIPSLAFISILTGICIVSITNKNIYPAVNRVCAVSSICGLFFLGLNLYSYDIGRSIDPSPTTMRQVYTELYKMPEGSIVYTPYWGHIRGVVSSYNRLNGSKLILVDGPMPKGDRERFTESAGVLLPDHTEFIPYGSSVKEAGEIMERDIQVIQNLNPDRMVYVSYLKDSTKVAFDFTSVNLYKDSLNDIRYD